MAKTDSKFEKLGEPIYIGKARLKNRMMKNGTGFFWDNPETGGFMEDCYISFFEALAKGGLALAVSAVAPLQEGPMPGFRALSDEYIPGWKKWADAIKKHDCLAFHQLFHLGPMSPLFAKAPPGVAPTTIPLEESPRPEFEVPHEITIPQIHDIVDRFASAAERMKKAGLQGTELNAACNHLLDCFLSRAWNKREDEYGCQNMENRTRIVVDIIKEIKRRNGEDWPIIALINGMEVGLKDGINVEESSQFAKIFEQAGADAIEVRAEYYTWADNWERRSSTHFPDMFFYPYKSSQVDEHVYSKEYGKGANQLMAEAIKKSVSVPVIVCGKMDWENGEKAIRDGKVDIISMNRRLLADPSAPRKVLEGRQEDIRPCTSCMTCYNLGEHFKPVQCRVNPSLGKEKEFEITPAETRKKVMVIGGGPSGMEAARVAALRGHNVVLYEKEKKTGGSLPLAQMVKGTEREDLMIFARWQSLQMKKAGVEIHTGTEVTPATVDSVKPDVLVLASGGAHRIPDVPGIKSRNVLTSKVLHKRLKFFLRFTDPGTLRKLSSIWLPGIGKKVVIMGGRLHGCETAEFLLHRGRELAITDTGTEEEMGEGLIEVFLKPYLFYWLKDNGVEILPEVKYEEINKQGLTITTKEGNKRTLKANTIITAQPLEPYIELQKRMEGKAKEIYPIGDTKTPGLIFDAVHDGAKTGREI
ncbi:MAG: FAD-dependent oxidoreductase [Desulfobacteraceae bacterium]|nr:FAD-dependent oxidoreductase [Desulfobacteraceae bacterium]